MEATWLLALVIVFAVFVGSLVSRSAELKHEQARINRKLDLLLKHFGIENPVPPEADYVPAALLPQIKELIETRKKVQAIKLLREHTGHSLLNAKNAIDALERQI